MRAIDSPKIPLDSRTFLIYSGFEPTYQERKETFACGSDKSGLDVYDQNGVNHGTRKEKADTISPINHITRKWTKNKGIKGSVSERLEYIVNGVTYKADGKYVILHPTGQEKATAEVLSKNTARQLSSYRR